MKRRSLITKAIQKYGIDNFDIEVILCEVSLQNQLEIDTIAKYLSNNSEFGYNLTEGGDYIGPMSPKQRKVHSEFMKGRIPWNKGKTGIYSPETIAKISQAAKLQATKQTQETRDKISKARVGITLSEETKKKISEGNKGKPKSAEHIENNRLARLGKKQTPEHIEKCRQATLSKRIPYNELPNTIEEAIASGIYKYKQIESCKHGHNYAWTVNKRTGVRSGCMLCATEQNINRQFKKYNN